MAIGVQSHDFGVVDCLMGSTRGEIEEEIVRIPREVVVEEKLYVAVSKDVKDCKPTVLWVLKHFEGRKICLLHVHQPSQMIPMMGGMFPPNKLTEQQVRAHRLLEKQKMHMMLNEYIFICAHRGVRAEKLFIDMENIDKGIVELVAQHEIKRLIMGAAIDKRTTTLKSKKAIFVNREAHISCHIWFVCKGSLIQTREGSLEGMEIRISDSPLASPLTETSHVDHLRSRSISEGQSQHVKLTSPVQSFFHRVRSHGRRVATVPSLDANRGVLMPQHQLGAEESVNAWEGMSRTSPSQGSVLSTWSSSEEQIGSLESNSVVRDDGSEDGSLLSSIRESEEDARRTSPTHELDEGRLDREMIDLLQQAMAEAENSKREAFDELVKRRSAEKDAIEAIRRVKESESSYANEVKRRKEMEVVLAREASELNKIKRQKDEVMEELKTALDQKMALESQLADSGRMLEEFKEKMALAVELLETFKQQRDSLQFERDTAVNEAEGLRKNREAEASSSQSQQFFSEFSFSEIDEATANFDPRLVIGQGGYGSVYRGFLRNTEVAIKLLNSNSKQGRSEFQQEVDVLSKMRHPNLLTLIGACPEAWALIYEYLPNGSLEDRLTCKDDTLPLSWQTRIRIAVEICSALIFLHYNKPHGIVHGDLKPSNILLDANFISKLGDFGICRSLSPDDISTYSTTLCSRTEHPKGTLVYMDPQFLSTGELTAKSDVYSFGIVLLQILTGRPALGIAQEVQYALNEGTLNALLDCSAGDWPFVQAKQLAYLALRCCEMNRKNRPDLVSEVWRVLKPMKAACASSSSFRLGSEEFCQIPSYFICPIFQEIMRDPRIAADGFTYEAEAIKGWLDGGNNTSPMTNLKLANCDLISNHSLRSAIEEWRQQH
ncbi:U-box domain-containing protein [Thalictrum thalictroides]|uniref:RING-type E3 ubiquitin transferase n=1 Tax=Thalictrum thalictroides TaxID=46969 RepID=A0A7J6XD95_THATH|nr:U-box domain-containing protein [Thalictrum thalictroides]